MSLIGSARANRAGLGEIAFRLEGDPVDVAVKGSGQDRRVDADRRKRDCDEREREPASELADPEDLTITHSGVSPHSPASQRTGVRARPTSWSDSGRQGNP